MRTSSGIVLLFLLAAAAHAAPWTFSVDAWSGELAAGPHRFGTRADADPGLDPHDVPEPPLPPSDYLALALRMAAPTDQWPDRWHHEFRPNTAFADELELWELALETDRPGEPVTVTVELIDGEPSQAEVYLLGPDGRSRLELPTSLTLTPVAPLTTLWIEVHVSDPVAAPVLGVSEVKRMFR